VLQPFAPSGDLTQDGSVDVADLQCLVIVYQVEIMAQWAGEDLCESDEQCQEEIGPDYVCRSGFSATKACYPTCLHPVVSFGETDLVECDLPGENSADCLGMVQKRSVDMNCDYVFTAVDFNFLVALLTGKLEGAGGADLDGDGQLNGCDPDVDGDGLVDILDCDPQDPEITDCDDANECTGDACVDGPECTHEPSGLCAAGEFQVNGAAVDQWGVAMRIAPLADGGFVAAYEGYGVIQEAQAVYAQRFDAFGMKNGAEFQVNDASDDPAYQPALAALYGGGFAVVWRGNTGIRGRRFDAAGAPVGDEILVSVTANVQPGHPAAAGTADGGFAAFWDSAMPGKPDHDVFVQRFGAAGEKAGPELTANSSADGDQLFPAGAGLGGGGFVSAWSGAGADDPDIGVFAQLFDNAGAPIGGEFLLAETTELEQGSVKVAALAGGGFVAAWFSEDQEGGLQVLARVYDSVGTPVSMQTKIANQPNMLQLGADVAPLPDGGFVAVWHGEQVALGTGLRVFAAMFDGNAIASGPVLEVEGDTSGEPQFPAVAVFSHGGFVAAWHAQLPPDWTAGILARLFASDGMGL